ncbi:LysR family transcriptional regulator [Litoreibacter roseus]|uniref:HTH lysR-type domain-containing protein n=1 Tax=Litoreibacter roseus TaxID=2601869 RepID=A0A6N6JD83_9RHOB|nr:LysR family transcriptional regulator [Litoreibacter roseus]GFE64115.1 hypothetical protein KIN_11890 [Litoreibacter roseus]
MDIENLKTMLLLARHGSFAAAARVLDLDPSSVSRIVSALEDMEGRNCLWFALPDFRSRSYLPKKVRAAINFFRPRFNA